MSFIPAESRAGKAPRTVELPVASGIDITKGALVLNTSGAYVECGADPVQISGIAIGAAGADTSGFNVLGRKEFPPLTLQAYVPERGQLFRAKYVGTLPAATAIGTGYGVVKDSDGIWKVDFNDTTADRVVLRQILDAAPEEIPEVVVEFLTQFISPLAI